MKRFFKFIIILILVAPIGPAAVLQAYIGDGNGVVINEVQPEGDGSAASPDWVELYNKATQPVNIAYWIINNQNDVDWDSVDNNLITWKNGSTYTDTSYPHCENQGGTDCLYMIPYDPATLTDSDPNNDYTLYVDPGCYVVIYNTSGTNDYSCSGDNEIKLYMGLDNKDVLVQDGDDVSLIPVFYYKAYDNNGNETEEGYIWLVMDYFAWNPGSVSTYNQHPDHCGAISNGVFYEYPTFGGHFDTYTDIRTQCDINWLYYYYGVYNLPYNFPVDFSSKTMNPSTLVLSSSYGRVPNGYDSDSADDFQVVEDTPGTTDVDVLFFSASRVNGKVVVTWKTGFENGVIGYNIFGGDSTSDLRKLNRKMIYSRGDNSTYTWTGSCNCKYVMLEVVEYGNHHLHMKPVEIGGEVNSENTTGGAGYTAPAILKIGEGENNVSGCSAGNIYDLWAILLLLGMFTKLYIRRREKI